MKNTNIEQNNKELKRKAGINTKKKKVAGESWISWCWTPLRDGPDQASDKELLDESSYSIWVVDYGFRHTEGSYPPIYKWGGPQRAWRAPGGTAGQGWPWPRRSCGPGETWDVQTRHVLQKERWQAVLGEKWIMHGIGERERVVFFELTWRERTKGGQRSLLQALQWPWI